MTLNDVDHRPKYFPGQYLLEDDFELEQNYHIDRQRRPNRLLHVSGIADGLIVTASGKDLNVKISAGTAIDKDGRQIVRSAAMEQNSVNLQDVNKIDTNSSYILSIGYFEEEKEPQEDATNGYRRWYETPKFELTVVSDENKLPTLPEGFIALAKIKVDGQQKVTVDDSGKSVREYSGLRLPSPANGYLTLRSGGDSGSNLAVLSGGLSVQGSLSVTGNVGIGITSPEIQLDINGPPATTDVNNPSKPWPIETQELLRLVRPSSSVVISGQNKSANAVGLFVGTFEEKSLGGTRFDIALSDYTSAGYGRTPNIKVMTLQSDGNVGIGTTSPKEKLEISGGNLKVSGNISASNATLTGNVGIGTTNPDTSKLKIANSASDFADISFSGSGMGQLQIIGWSSGWNINAKTAGKHLYFNRDSDATSNVYIGRSGKELFVRGTDGNVAIGTASPISNSKLEIAGTSGDVFSAGVPLVSGSGTTQPSTSSTANIDLSGHVQLKEYGDLKFAYLQARDDRLNRDIGLQIRTQQAGDNERKLIEALTINPSGNVGIGTTSPTQKLVVVGGLRIVDPNDPSNFLDIRFEFRNNTIVFYNQNSKGFFLRAGGELNKNNTTGNW